VDKEEIEDLVKSESEYQEVKEWEGSGSEDKFDIWKLKKYINHRIIIGILTSVLITFAVLKFA